MDAGAHQHGEGSHRGAARDHSDRDEILLQARPRMHELVGQTVSLRRSGPEMVGPCPWHKSDDDGVKVSSRNGLAVCFSCEYSLDPIGWVMKRDGCDFLAALHTLGAWLGVPVRGGPGSHDTPAESPQEARERRERIEAATRAREEQEQLERRQSLIRAKKTIDEAQADAPRVREYLAARGVLVDRMHPQAWQALRYHARVWYHAGQRDDGRAKSACLPAMVATILGPAGDVIGCQRVMLHPTKPAKAQIDAPKRVLGTFVGGAIRMSPVAETLILAEGPETAAACHSAADCAAWSVVVAQGFEAFQWPTDGSCDRVRVLILAADLDRVSGQDGMGPGMRAVLRLAARLRRERPGLDVRVAVPGNAHAPTLVGADGSPVEGVKKVDWLDVLNAAGKEPAARGLLRSPAPATGELDRVEAEQRAKTGGAAESTTEPAHGDPPGTPPPVTGRKGRGNSPGDQDRVLPKTYAGKARLLLRMRFAPQARKHGRWHVAYWNDEWYVYEPKRCAWRVRDQKWMHDAVSDALDGRVVIRVVDKDPKSGDEIVVEKRWAPTERQLGDVVSRLRTECRVEPEVQPAWIPPTHDASGAPVRASGLRDHDPSAGPFDTMMSVGFRNVVLNGTAWAHGKVITEPNSPGYFSTHTQPHDLPVARLQDFVRANGPDAPGGELYSDLCPTWLRYVQDVAQDDEGWIRSMQEWFGYLLVADTRFQKLALLVGVPGSGKSTCMTAMRLLVGRDQVEQTTLSKIAGRFEMANFLKRRLILLPDAVTGRTTDSVVALENIKMLSGGDDITPESKHLNRGAAVRLPVKLVISVNEMPKLDDPSASLKRRLLPFVFGPSYEGREDRELESKVKSEREGIVLWSLFGLRDLYRRGGFLGFDSARRLIDDYCEKNAPLKVWVDDWCVVGPQHRCDQVIMHAAYNAWARAVGMDEKDPRKIGSELRAVVAGIKVDRPGKGQRLRHYIGVRPVVRHEDGHPRHVIRLDECSLPESPAPHVA